MLYSQTQWELLFFSYSFLGWVWECLYVSLRRREWINRGFLRGPWLPIYGTGAVLILLATLPVRESGALVFLLGMVTATALEYVTGAAIEKIFHVRYWDYSDQPLNLHGYICLPVSVGWGVFSLFLIRVLHPPVEQLVRALPAAPADGVALVLTVLFVMDATHSIQSALDMKETMKQLAGSSQRLERMEEKLDLVAARLGNSSEKWRQRWRRRTQELASAAQTRREQNEHRRRARLEQRLEEMWADKRARLTVLREKVEEELELISTRLRESAPEERRRLERIRTALNRERQAIDRADAELDSRREREVRRALSILRRNPTAASRRYGGAVEEMRGLLRSRSDQKHSRKEGK